MTADVEMRPSGLLSRIEDILLRPQRAWAAIADEPADNPYLSFALPLAVLAAIAHVIGYTFLNGYANTPLIESVIAAALDWVATLATLYIVARVTHVLAPRFASEADEALAHKLIVYSATAMLLGRCFAIWPSIEPLAIVGLYSIALLHIGAPRLMKTPEEKRFGFVATIVVAWIVVGAVLGWGVSAAGDALVKLLPRAQPEAAAPQTPSAPAAGSATIDLAALASAARAAETATVRPLDPERLQNLLPNSLPGGFQLTSSSSSADTAAQAQGVYENGAQRITLTLTQTGTVGNQPAAAPDLRSYEGPDGYARMNVADGRLYGESMNTSEGKATYAVLGYGVLIAAEGAGGVMPDQVRAAVETVGIQRLERELRI